MGKDILIFFGICEVKFHFKTIGKWTTKLFLGRPLHRENIPRRFKKDDSLVFLYLGNLVFMDHEVWIPISRNIQKEGGRQGFLTVCGGYQVLIAEKSGIIPEEKLAQLAGFFPELILCPGSAQHTFQ